MKHEYLDYGNTAPRLFVSVLPIVCDVRSHDPVDFRKEGIVASLEYERFAQYCEIFQHLPEFNDPEQSPNKYRPHKQRA